MAGGCRPPICQYGIVRGDNRVNKTWQWPDLSCTLARQQPRQAPRRSNAERPTSRLQPRQSSTTHLSGRRIILIFVPLIAFLVLRLLHFRILFVCGVVSRSICLALVANLVVIALLISAAGRCRLRLRLRFGRFLGVDACRRGLVLQRLCTTK